MVNNHTPALSTSFGSILLRVSSMPFFTPSSARSSAWAIREAFSRPRRPMRPARFRLQELAPVPGGKDFDRRGGNLPGGRWRAGGNRDRRIREGQLPVHNAPAARGAFGQSPRFDVTAQAFLRGRVGYGVCGSFREDILLRHLEKRDAIGPDVEVSANQRLFNRQHALAVAVVVRVPAFERAVDEEADRRSGRGLILARRTCRRTDRRLMPCCASRPALLDRPRQRFGSGVCALCHRRTPLWALLYDSLSICLSATASFCLPRTACGGPPPPPEAEPGRPQGTPRQDDGESSRGEDGRIAGRVSFAYQDSPLILTSPP